MKILRFLLAASGVFLAVCVFAFFVAVFMLPAAQSFENEVEIAASAEKVWEVIADKKRFAEWQTQLEKLEIIDEKNWLEYPKDSLEPLKFSLASDDRPAKMEFRYTIGDSFSGQWKGEILPTPTGVELKTIDSYSTQGWLTKILIYAFFDLDSFAKDWNAKLKQRVESSNK